MIISNNFNPSIRYFAASNSADGFKSYFGELFYSSKIKRRYIIKGGPGTGKSSFMKFLGTEAEEKGKTVEYYYCSSDTDSLDGIIIDGKVAVIDGTSPHACEPNLAGAVDEIVNLGEFWSSENLSARKNEIAVLSDRKKTCYSRAYSYLAATKDCLSALESLAESCRNRPKMMAAVGRMAEKLPNGTGAGLIPVCISAIGVNGRKRLDTLEKRATKIYRLSDCCGSAHIYLDALARELLKKERELTVAYDPVYPERIEAIFLEGSGECFSVGCAQELEDDDSRINMKRFIYPESLAQIRGKYRAGEKVREALLSLAETELLEAGRTHFELEKIYISSMNFKALNAFFENMALKIVN